MQSIKNESANFWNQNPCGGEWTDYEGFMKWYINTEPYIIDLFKNIDFNHCKVLDVGCGQGVVINWLCQKNAHAYGLDMSLNSLIKAKKGAVELNLTNCKNYLQADAERLPFRHNYFDFIISLGVLHHTPNIQAAIDEIYQLLCTNGKIIIMLYRKGTPKWIMTKLLRTFSHIIKRIKNKNRLTDAKKYEKTLQKGTAIFELFDVPIMNAYSNQEAKNLFSAFQDISITNYQPGFRRLVDFFPFLKVIAPLLNWLDDKTQAFWGFYQVITAIK